MGQNESNALIGRPIQWRHRFQMISLLKMHLFLFSFHLHLKRCVTFYLKIAISNRIFLLFLFSSSVDYIFVKFGKEKKNNKKERQQKFNRKLISFLST